MDPQANIQIQIYTNADTWSRDRLSESSVIFGDDLVAQGKVVEGSSPRTLVASLDSIASAGLEGPATPRTCNEPTPQVGADENVEQMARGSPGLFRKCLPWKGKDASEHRPNADTDDDDDDPFAGATAEAPASPRTAIKAPAPSENSKFLSGHTSDAPLIGDWRLTPCPIAAVHARRRVERARRYMHLRSSIYYVFVFAFSLALLRTTYVRTY
jgi:hypothetical protein